MKRSHRKKGREGRNLSKHDTGVRGKVGGWRPWEEQQAGRVGDINVWGGHTRRWRCPYCPLQIVSFVILRNGSTIPHEVTVQRTPPPPTPQQSLVTRRC
eukprot:765018-Hanusia_phi.AAC.2